MWISSFLSERVRKSISHNSCVSIKLHLYQWRLGGCPVWRLCLISLPLFPPPHTILNSILQPIYEILKKSRFRIESHSFWVNLRTKTLQWSYVWWRSSGSSVRAAKHFWPYSPEKRFWLDNCQFLHLFNTHGAKWATSWQQHYFGLFSPGVCKIGRVWEWRLMYK